MLYGWDVSTAIIGSAVFELDGTYRTGSFCDIRKVEGLYAKADVAREFVNDIVFRWRAHPDIHFIEDRLAGFGGGGSNAGTIMQLAAFNAMVSWAIHDTLEKSDELHHLHPSTVKAIMKKEGLIIPKGGDKKALTLKWVGANIEEFPPVTLTKVTKRGGGNPQPWFYDMADAVITGYAGKKKNKI